MNPPAHNRKIPNESKSVFIYPFEHTSQIKQKHTQNPIKAPTSTDNTSANDLLLSSVFALIRLFMYSTNLLITSVFFQVFLKLFRLSISAAPIKLRAKTSIQTFRNAFACQYRVCLFKIAYHHFPSLSRLF